MNNTLDLVRFVTVLVRFAATVNGISIKGSTHKPSVRHETSGFLAFVRLGGTEIINANTYCGMLRHRVVIDLYSPKTDPRNIEDVFGLYAAIVNEFPRWGCYLKKAGTVFDDTLNTKASYETGNDEIKTVIDTSKKPLSIPFVFRGLPTTARVEVIDDTKEDSDKYIGEDDIGKFVRYKKPRYHTTEEKADDDQCLKLEKIEKGISRADPLDLLKCRVRTIDSEDKMTEESMRTEFEKLINLDDGEPGPYELASSYLENSGSYSMQDYSGAGIELTFAVDEKVCSC